MSSQGQFRKAFFCLALSFAAFGGALMRPEEIEDLMRTMNQPKIAHKLPDDYENGEDLLRKLLNRAPK